MSRSQSDAPGERRTHRIQTSTTSISTARPTAMMQKSSVSRLDPMPAIVTPLPRSRHEPVEQVPCPPVALTTSRRGVGDILDDSRLAGLELMRRRRETVGASPTVAEIVFEHLVICDSLVIGLELLFRRSPLTVGVRACG